MQNRDSFARGCRTSNPLPCVSTATNSPTLRVVSDEGASATSDGDQLKSSVPSPHSPRPQALFQFCVIPHCPKASVPFKGSRGLSQHMRKSHPAEYHLEQAKIQAESVIRRNPLKIEEIRLLAYREKLYINENPGFNGDTALKLVDIGATQRSYAVVRKIRSRPDYKQALAVVPQPGGTCHNDSQIEEVFDPLNVAFVDGSFGSSPDTSPAKSQNISPAPTPKHLPPKHCVITPPHSVQPRANDNPFVDSDSDSEFNTPRNYPTPIHDRAANPSALPVGTPLNSQPNFNLGGDFDSSESQQWVQNIRSALTAMETSIDLSTVIPGAGEINQGPIDVDFTEWIPPPPPTNSRRRTPPRKLPENKRARRRALYSRFQRMYKRQRAKAAETVLEGTWDQETSDIPLPTQDRYWRKLFETPSQPDDRKPEPVRETQWSLLSPFSQSEVLDALKRMKPKTSPGLDGRTVSLLRKLNPVQLVSRFNLWALAGCIPKELHDGYTSLIPKEVGTDDPAKFRPITVSSAVVRLFHKCYATRLEADCPTSERQKAFKAVDGCRDNTLVLQALLKRATDPKAPKDCYVAFLDVKKAFDSVSHDSLLIAATRAGIPPPLLNYVRYFYCSANTRLRVSGQNGEVINVAQGVRQGDPMSCWLFNVVIDWALGAINPAVGIDLADQTLSHLAFADDIALLASSRDGLQEQIRTLSDHLLKSGLSLSAGKCTTLSIVVSRGRTKKWHCDDLNRFQVGGDFIPSMNIAETYKYLGLRFGARGANSDITESLDSMLKHLTAAPLKPAQRLWILKQKLIPKLQYQLVLGETSAGYLRFVDCTIRSALRRWLKLPNDTSKAAFYADVKDGGLGILSFEHVIPSLKIRRFSTMSSSTDPIVRAVCSLPWFQREMDKWRKPTLHAGLLTATPQLRRQAFKHDLTAVKVDGRGLRDASLVDGQHAWLDAGNAVMSGAKFSAAIGVRLGTLPTRGRGSRGRPGSGFCDCCGPTVVEHLYHVLQTCPRTHGPRIARHDRILSEVAKMFGRIGYKTLVEPHFKTVQGLRKPDLLVYGEGKPSVILDVAVSTDNLPDPDSRHWDKVRYYSQYEEISAGVELISGTRPEFSSVTLNWRGLFSPSSAADLRRLGLTLRDIGLLAMITVEQGAIIHRVFNTSTMVTHRAHGLRAHS